MSHSIVSGEVLLRAVLGEDRSDNSCITMSSENRQRNAFISHHHNDDESVTNLTDLLSRRGYQIRNSSIRAKPANQRRLDQGLVKEETIRRLLRMKISWAGVVVVLI